VALLDWLKEIAPIATAIGVSVGVLQLWNAKRQAVTTFEDALANEYRRITGKLPTAALLGERLSPDVIQTHLPEFYRYFDLCNNQIFLRQINRISAKTWRFWVDGIRTNLGRPAFSETWKYIGERAGADFQELRRLILEEFQRDPRRW
jgi:hypothetical protein